MIQRGSETVESRTEQTEPWVSNSEEATLYGMDVVYARHSSTISHSVSCSGPSPWEIEFHSSLSWTPSFASTPRFPTVGRLSKALRSPRQRSLNLSWCSAWPASVIVAPRTTRWPRSSCSPRPAWRRASAATISRCPSSGSGYVLQSVPAPVEEC